MAHTSRGCRAGADEVEFAGVPVGAPLRGFGFREREGRATRGAKAVRIYAKDGAMRSGSRRDSENGRKNAAGRAGRKKRKEAVPAM